MSPKRDGYRSNAEADLAETLQVNTRSYNECSTASARSDSNDDVIRRAARRFWSHVNKTETCWLWTASTTGQQDHGQFTYRVFKKQLHIYAHRFSWLLHNGPIPDDLCVLHRCDVPRCVRPDHLFLGTRLDNMNDARVKGRLIDGVQCRKLSDDAYREILAFPRPQGSGNALAAKFGVTKITISRIRHGKQGSTFHNSQKALQPSAPPSQQSDRNADVLSRYFERVPSVHVEIRGEVR